MTTLRRTRIKVCGITRTDDALAAIAAGVDAIGLVFHPKSPRCLDIQRASAIVEVLPPFVTTVGVFVDLNIEQYLDIDDYVHLHVLQLHGTETPGQCRQFGRPYIKGVRMREDVDLNATEKAYADCRALLLDSYRPDLAGGTGETFPWQKIPSSLTKPFILAGGLNADNVGEAIKITRPFAVDVSTGVERERGVKDIEKIERFVHAVWEADRQIRNK